MNQISSRQLGIAAIVAAVLFLLPLAVAVSAGAWGLAGMAVEWARGAWSY